MLGSGGGSDGDSMRLQQQCKMRNLLGEQLDLLRLIHDGLANGGKVAFGDLGFLIGGVGIGKETHRV